MLISEKFKESANDDRMYPIDIHCPGQLFVTLSRLHKLDEYRPLAEKVMNWTIFA